MLEKNPSKIAFYGLVGLKMAILLGFFADFRKPATKNSPFIKKKLACEKILCVSPFFFSKKKTAMRMIFVVAAENLGIF
jgi:hypothetical protein